MRDTVPATMALETQKPRPSRAAAGKAASPNRRHWLGHWWWNSAPPGMVPRITRALTIDRRQPWGRTQKITTVGWLLCRTQTGSGLIRVGSPRGPWLDRKACTAVLMPPGTIFWEDASALTSPVQMSYILFYGGEAVGLRKFLRPPSRMAEFNDPKGIIEDLLHRMALAGQHHGEHGFWLAQSLLATLLDTLQNMTHQAGDNRWAVGPASKPQESCSPVLEAAEAYFRRHLAEPISVADIANHVHMSASSFAHCFTKLTGKSPMVALNDVRMEAARDLLLHGVKIEIIARQTGFCDAFHFSKTFRRHYGVSPSRFRSRELDAAAAPADAAGNR